MPGAAAPPRARPRCPTAALVDFTATWCPPCRALAPILRALAAEHAGRIEVRTVDGDEHVALAARYRVKAFPTIIAFAGGEEVARHVG